MLLIWMQPHTELEVSWNNLAYAVKCIGMSKLATTLAREDLGNYNITIILLMHNS